MDVKDMEQNKDLKPIPTKATRLLNDKAVEFKAVQFVEPSNQYTSNFNEVSKQPFGKTKNRSKDVIGTPDDNEDFDIKKARTEILNFAAKDRCNSVLSKQEKKLREQQMMWIGTKVKHLKNPYENYKELLAKRKREKEQRDKLGKFHQLGKNQNGMSTVKCNSKRKLLNPNRKRVPVSNIDQNYGTIKAKIKGKIK